MANTWLAIKMWNKNNLKILKGYSESVNQRRTDNTITKKKVQKDKQRSTKHYIYN
jgi:hypothetical protein